MIVHRQLLEPAGTVSLSSRQSYFAAVRVRDDQRDGLPLFARRPGPLDLPERLQQPYDRVR